ncbi:AMP-binding protein [Microcoleus sp. AR_TQ3_B6]|uniref:AMP-binding protein n=1 Tax=Microcoleus sp. AR_TQ3_B6 TaxID=3055284 RepID=UPI002FD62403
MMETVVERFLAVAQANPNALAVITDNGTWTYKALALRTRQIADAIDQWFKNETGRSADVSDIIGISLDKNADLLASMIAIMALGAAYVPIDPELNRNTQTYILDRCNCKLVVCKPDALRGIDTIGRIDPTAIEIDGKPKLIEPRAHLEDRCYTIFTSGSTGHPSGVPILHRNLVNLCKWVTAEFGLGRTNRVLQFSTINFDASVLDIFPALTSGAALCLPTGEQRLSENELAWFCMHHHIDHAFLPPALLAVLNSERFPQIRTVLTGGEACSHTTLAAWAPTRRFFNLYGPTECTVVVSFKEISAEMPQKYRSCHSWSAFTCA